MTIIDILLSDFLGSPILLAVALIVIVLSLVIFVKGSKYVIEAFLLLIVYAFTVSGYLKAWVFFIVLMVIGLDIGKSILSTFFSTR